MPVMKHDDAQPVIKDAIVLDLGDVSRQAKRLLAAAETKARQILASAKQEADRLIAAAHEQGTEKGYEQGLEKGLSEGQASGHDEALQQRAEQLDQLQKAWIDAATTWESQRQTMEREARRCVLALALSFADKIVHRTIQTDDQVILDQVSAALAHVLQPTEVTIRICPEDRPVLEQAMPQLIARLDKNHHVRLADDPTIKPGGCVVSHGQGCIDASIDTQLNRLVRLLVPAPTATRPHDAALDADTLVDDEANVDSRPINTTPQGPADHDDGPTSLIDDEPNHHQPDAGTNATPPMEGA